MTSKDSMPPGPLQLNRSPVCPTKKVPFQACPAASLVLIKRHHTRGPARRDALPQLSALWCNNLLTVPQQAGMTWPKRQRCGVFESPPNHVGGLLAPQTSSLTNASAPVSSEHSNTAMAAFRRPPLTLAAPSVSADVQWSLLRPGAAGGVRSVASACPAARKCRLRAPPRTHPTSHLRGLNPLPPLPPLTTEPPEAVFRFRPTPGSALERT
ncbi:hypothetical protein T484DRAFT_2794522 [Baffinella frigidus]|nr:hypothetical protein T484DRAFT_2794522 [Cryptophyta sp. CCMP2293]